jgi:hypothetical protein
MTDEPKDLPPEELPRGQGEDESTTASPLEAAPNVEADEEMLDEDIPDSGRFKSLLKMAVEAPPPPPKSDVLSGVQKRLRERSEGKFYADGWSTREDNPRFTYLVTAIVMLLLLVIAYVSLVPSGIGKLP